jgi:GNAT superfamily N-acetyltransferase
MTNDGGDMDGPRSLYEHELGDLVRFLSGHLRPQHQWTIQDEYPLAIQTANLNNVRVIKDKDRFLSAAVMKPMVIKSPSGLFKAAGIGSVVTSPDVRNQGFSRQVLDDCLAAARAHGCDFAILWTNLFDFYRKLGFELAGTEVALEVPRNVKVEDSTDLHFMNTNKIDPDAILRLYNSHATGCIRTPDEIRKYLQIPNTRVFTAWDKNNRIQAYAIEGKGADLDGYIHEWGGGVSKLLPLIKYAVQAEDRSLTLISPAHSTNLIRQLTLAGARETHGVLGMIKILNPSHFLAKIKKYIRAMGFEDVVLEPRDGRYYMGYRDQIFSTDSETDLVRVIFGPLKATDLGVFDSDTAGTFEKLFPIAMWIWGWDSV